MQKTTMLRHGLLALAAALAMPAAHAMQAGTTPMVLADTVTELKMDWSWNALAGSYLGTHWNAWFTPSWNDQNSSWSVVVSYQHLDGPHGELAEGSVHALPTLAVAQGGWGVLGGTDDHLPPTPHLQIHTWNLAATGATDNSNGWAALDVQHPVPEPGTWLMLAGGLAALAWRSARRR